MLVEGMGGWVISQKRIRIGKPGAQETTLLNVTGTVSRNNPRSLCELNRSSLLLVPKVVNYGRSPIENCFIFMSLLLIYQLIYSS